jgi:protein-S-isoprenylcysteine O-methyltransferase Ste14
VGGELAESEFGVPLLTTAPWWCVAAGDSHVLPRCLEELRFANGGDICDLRNVNDEQRFRIILLLVFVIFMPVGIYHRLKSQTGEKLDRRQEGLFILITLRAIAAVGMVGMIAYFINPATMAWAAVPLPIWMRYMGVGLAVLAGALFVWTLRTLGRNLTDTVVTRKEHTLVTTGPYRWVRHPFYSAAALLTLASTLVAASGFLLVAGGLIFLLLVKRTRREEANLLSRFGDDYRNYMQRTGRFVPRL